MGNLMRRDTSNDFASLLECWQLITDPKDNSVFAIERQAIGRVFRQITATGNDPYKEHIDCQSVTIGHVCRSSVIKNSEGIFERTRSARADVGERAVEFIGCQKIRLNSGLIINVIDEFLNLGFLCLSTKIFSRVGSVCVRDNDRLNRDCFLDL